MCDIQKHKPFELAGGAKFLHFTILVGHRPPSPPLLNDAPDLES